MPQERAWLSRSQSVPHPLQKPPGATMVPGTGQVFWDAPVQVNWQPCQGGDRPKIGRELWDRSVTNPYQFDKTFVNRVESFKMRAQDRLEELATEPPLSSRSGMSSGRGSVPERQYSARRAQSFEYTNKTPFTVHSRESPNLVLSIARDKPGYMGYIPGEKSENVFGWVWNKNVAYCNQLTGPLRSQAYDGARGMLPLPQRYPEVRTHPARYLCRD
ncbi:unnamed protein product [Amoebophrya sp. A25]|nr:unnamed protein product [Amoebophrya sp. A25]|eukprot:GSA25T00003920001.1